MSHLQFLQHYNRVKSLSSSKPSSSLEYMSVLKEKTLDSIPRSSIPSNEDKHLFDSEPILPLVQSLPSTQTLNFIKPLADNKPLDDIEILPGGRRAQLVKGRLKRILKNDDVTEDKDEKSED